MSFLSSLTSFLGKALKGLNVGLAVEQQAAPLVNLIPGGSVVNSVVNDILLIEAQFPQSGLGPTKLALTAASAATKVPGINPVATQEAISQIVQGFNALNKAAAAATPPAVP